MLRKIMCKIFTKIYGGKLKSIDNEYYVEIRKESLEPAMNVRVFGFMSLNIYAPIIKIEGNYDRIFNEDEMKFALYHELAHCKYNHFKLPIRQIEQEIEADLYAMSIVGKDTAISALEKVKEEARWTGRGATEVVLRIFECEHIRM